MFCAFGFSWLDSSFSSLRICVDLTFQQTFLFFRTTICFVSRFQGTTQRSCSADGPWSQLAQRVVTVSPCIQLLWIVVVLFVSMARGESDIEYRDSCGEFISVSRTKRAFQTPRFLNYSRCIWVLQAPQTSTIHIFVNFTGMSVPEDCGFFQVREGQVHGPLVMEGLCGKNVVQEYISTKRWLYIMFVSDGDSKQGILKVVYSTSTLVPAKEMDPTVCAAYEFKCANKLCISYAYVCDDFDDCGCGKPGVCDEEGCTAELLGFTLTLTIALTLGVAITVPVLAAGMLLEKHHNWDNVLPSEKMSLGGTSDEAIKTRKSSVAKHWKSAEKLRLLHKLKRASNESHDARKSTVLIPNLPADTVLGSRRIRFGPSSSALGSPETPPDKSV